MCQMPGDVPGLVGGFRRAWMQTSARASSAWAGGWWSPNAVPGPTGGGWAERRHLSWGAREASRSRPGPPACCSRGRRLAGVSPRRPPRSAELYEMPRAAGSPCRPWDRIGLSWAETAEFAGVLPTLFGRWSSQVKDVRMLASIGSYFTSDRSVTLSVSIRRSRKVSKFAQTPVGAQHRNSSPLMQPSKAPSN